MSLDKFVMRGFTGSVGSGEGRWVASSVPTAQAPAAPVTQHPAGSSFVMGGGGLRTRPTPTANSKASHSEFDSSKGEAMGGGERYSYDPDKVRSKGTKHEYGKHPGCFGSRSFNDTINTKRGHQVMVGVVLYGIALFILIFCIIAMFGDGNNEDFYTGSPSLPKKAKPMWARDR
jgi:hypothetical protein